MEGLGRWVREHLFLEFLYPLPVLFEDNEVVVHHPVHEGVGQVVAPHLPDPALCGAYSIPHRIEHVTFAFLERNHEVGAEDHAHLLGVEFLVPVVGEHLENHVEVGIHVLEFRPLARVDDILQDEGMDAEEPPEAF